MVRTTLCYIENKDRYLMMLRNKKQNDPNAGKWVGIGGKFREGETPDECMIREVREETGLAVREYRFHGVIHFRSDTWEDEDMYLYSAKAPDTASIEEDICDEGTLRWIEKNEIMGLSLWEGDRLFLEKLISGEEHIEMTLHDEGDTLIEWT